MYLTSDTHFGHALMARLRGYENAVEEHDRVLVEMWNDVVRPRSPVWHLGDFWLGRDPEQAARIFKRLHGQKSLCRGNHDGAAVLALPWDEVVDLRHVRHDKRRMTLCHYRMADWPGAGRGAVMLYGHRHGQVPPTADSLDVGVDCWGLAPAHVDNVFARLREVAASAAS